MSESQFWAGLALAFLVAGALITWLGRGKLANAGWLLIAAVGCIGMTIYVFVFDPDPQAPVFLFLFYIVAFVACAIGAAMGWVLRRLRRAS